MLHWVGVLLSLHTMPINPLLLPMEPLIFTFYFTVEGYDVFITIEFFPHIEVKHFSLGFYCCFCQVQPLFLAWIGLTSHRKPLGTISGAHSWVSAWLPNISFRGINFSLNINERWKVCDISPIGIMFRRSFLPFKIESKIHKSQYVLLYFKIPSNTLILN